MAIIHCNHEHKVLINDEWKWPVVDYEFDTVEREVNYLAIDGVDASDKMIQDITETIIETGACYG